VGPEDINFVHVHDAFPIEELMYYELLGFAAPGEGDKLVYDGTTALGGKCPWSTDGGLIARGHPGGPRAWRRSGMPPCSCAVRPVSVRWRVRVPASYT